LDVPARSYSAWPKRAGTNRSSLPWITSRGVVMPPMAASESKRSVISGVMGSQPQRKVWNMSFIDVKVDSSITPLGSAAGGPACDPSWAASCTATAPPRE
jgi:hypothetical protein